MRIKEIKILICIFLICFGSFAYFSSVYGESEEVDVAYGFLGFQLYYEVNSTIEVKVGDPISVQLFFRADSNISDVYIFVLIYGAGVSYYKDWTEMNLTTSQSVVETLTLQAEEEGDIRCTIDALYLDDVDGDWGYGLVDFLMAQAKEITYGELSQNFINLNQSYNELNENYSQSGGNYGNLNQNNTSLESNYENLQDNYDELVGKYNTIINELNMYKNLLYVFITTTVVSIALTIFVYFKKSKR